MKILHIIPNLRKGGAERIAIDICNELSRQGSDVILITFHNQNEYEFLTTELKWNVIPSFIKPSISGKTSVDVANLQAFIDDFQPDIIHTHLFEAEMVVSQIDYPKAAYFVHFHNNIPQLRNLNVKQLGSKLTWTDRYEKKILQRVYKRRNVTAIAISKDVLSYATRVLSKNVRKVLLFNAINRSRFYSELTQTKGDRIVMIGSLNENKDQLLAAKTIVELNRRGTHIHLDLLGDGPLKPQLEEYIAKNNIGDWIHLHGSVDHPESYLKDASIYLHTSKAEAFGLVMVEAMAAGLPVICTDGGGNRDLIIEGENGFMVEKRSAELLAEKIEYLINHPEKRMEMGRNAQAFSSQFDISAYVEKLLGLYTSQLEC